MKYIFTRNFILRSSTIDAILCDSFRLFHDSKTGKHYFTDSRLQYKIEKHQKEVDFETINQLHEFFINNPSLNLRGLSYYTEQTFPIEKRRGRWCWKKT